MLIHSYDFGIYQACYPTAGPRKESVTSSMIEHWETASRSSLDSAGNNVDSDSEAFSFEGEMSEDLCISVAERLEKEVLLLSQRVFYPHEMTLLDLTRPLELAAKSIVQESANEPYGVMGANIRVKLCNAKGKETVLGTINWNKAIVSTFELELVLTEEPHLGTSIRNWWGQVTGGRNHIVQLSPRFSLKKDRLYR